MPRSRGPCSISRIDGRVTGGWRRGAAVYSNSSAAAALRSDGRGFFGAPTKAQGSSGESGSRLKNRLILSTALRICRCGYRCIIRLPLLPMMIHLPATNVGPAYNRAMIDRARLHELVGTLPEAARGSGRAGAPADMAATGSPRGARYQEGAAGVDPVRLGTDGGIGGGGSYDLGAGGRIEYGH